MKPNITHAAAIQLQNTAKFKDIVISVRFLCPLERKLALSRSLLSSMMQDRSEKYDTKNKVTAALDDLYGAFIASRTVTYGKAHLLEFRCKALNEKFCTTAHLEKQFELVHQFIFHPLLSPEAFHEAKENLIDSIMRRLDKPASYASNQAMKMMGENEALADACLASVEEIEAVTLDDVKKAWEHMMHHNHICVQIQGEINEDVMRSYIKRFLPFDNSETLPESEYLIHKTSLSEKTEVKHIDQSTLIMMYETHLKASDPDFWKLRTANALFGQLPTSLLFQEVREKRSLCYSVYSSVMSYEGCMSVSCGVSYESLNEAQDVIKQQFERMKNGDFDDNDLATAKVMLKDSVLSTADDMNAMLNYEYQNLILSQKLSIEDCLAVIDATQKEDVMRLFNQIEHKVTYILKQEADNEENSECALR